MDFKVYEPNQVKDKKLQHINTKLLPHPPLRGIIVGSSGSGKTQFILNILFNWYKKYYDEIYCFIGSKDDAIEYRRLAKKNRMSDRLNVIEKMDLEKIEELYDDIEKSNLYDDEKSNVLFVFDDRILDISKRKHSVNIIDELFIKGRHARISTIISTQKYKLLNTNMRVCNTNLLVIFPSNNKELQAIAEEHSGLENPKDFLEKLKKNLKVRYNYIVLDLTKAIDNRLRNKKFQPLDE